MRFISLVSTTLQKNALKMEMNGKNTFPTNSADCSQRFSTMTLLKKEESKVHLASGIYVCARDQQERSAGEDDSFSKTTLRRLNHSSQSSLDTFLAAPHACTKYKPARSVHSIYMYSLNTCCYSNWLRNNETSPAISHKIQQWKIRWLRDLWSVP